MWELALWELVFITSSSISYEQVNIHSLASLGETIDTLLIIYGETISAPGQKESAADL